MMYQKTGYQKNYYQPKKPVKSFQDLEVYQKLLGVSVAIAKRVGTKENGDEKVTGSIAGVLLEIALDLPVKIAWAHSLRFGDGGQAIEKLDEVMLDCNLAVVYLEQYRDLGKHEIETEFFDEQIKTLLATRGKVLHLQMSWKKFRAEYYNDKKEEVKKI